jgi:hypothetical protein
MLAANRHPSRLVLAAVAACLGSPGAASADAILHANALAPQACAVRSRDWTLEKSSSVSGDAVTWTVTASPGEPGTTLLTVSARLRILNTGDTVMALGSIVVNLQGQQQQAWSSLSADVATAASGDAATLASLVAAASTEVAPNAAGNYAVSGAIGTFTEGTGSGQLNLTDVASNTVFSLMPRQLLSPSTVTDLVVSATFDATALAIDEGDPLRAELLVTVDSPFAIGGDGFAATGFDVDGSGSPDDFGRTVGLPLSFSAPQVEECNAHPMLADAPDALATTGTVTVMGVDTLIGGGAGSELLGTAVTRTVTATFDPGPDGGTISNTATLTAPASSLTLPGPADMPAAVEVACCPGVELAATSTVELAPRAACGPWHDGDHVTHTHGGWHADPHGQNPGTLLQDHYHEVYPDGHVEVGIPGQGGFSMSFGSPEAVRAYIGGGGRPDVLTADLVDPLTSSSGVYGKQVLTLRLNVDFSAADIPPTEGGALGNLVVTGAGAPWDGMNVDGVLRLANDVLGGAPPPEGLTISNVNDIVTNLNEAFVDGSAGWGVDHLLGCCQDVAGTHPTGPCGCDHSDADGDATLDCLDNCPHDANADQADADGDGEGDACEPPCVMGDIHPHGTGNGVVNLADYIMARRLGLGIVTWHPHDACGDVHPGSLACDSLTGADHWCPQGNGSINLGDILVVRRMALLVLEVACEECAIQLARALPTERRVPGDVAPAARPDGRVDVADVTLALRLAVGLDGGAPDRVLRADVAPARPEGALLAVGGDGSVTIADAVLLLRAAVGLETLAWPLRELAVDIGSAPPFVGSALSVQGWPSWAELIAVEVTGCADGASDGIEPRSSGWATSCVTDPVPLADVTRLATITYRAPEPLPAEGLTVTVSVVDATLDVVEVPGTLVASP